MSQIADISRGPSGNPVVHKVWCAVDCGVAIKPNVITAQMEGGIGYGLSAILFNAITLQKGGAVTQWSFNDYRSMRINEMLNIEVAIIKSAAPLTRVGGPGVPPIGPAVAIARRRLTGITVARPPIIQLETS